MNLYRIREVVSRFLNSDKLFIYRGSRGHIEKFNGKIIKLFPRIFIIMDNKSCIRSFSYSDFAIGNIKIH